MSDLIEVKYITRPKGGARVLSKPDLDGETNFVDTDRFDGNASQGFHPVGHEVLDAVLVETVPFSKSGAGVFGGEVFTDVDGKWKVSEANVDELVKVGQFALSVKLELQKNPPITPEQDFDNFLASLSFGTTQKADQLERIKKNRHLISFN